MEKLRANVLQTEFMEITPEELENVGSECK